MAKTQEQPAAAAVTNSNTSTDAQATATIPAAVTPPAGDKPAPSVPQPPSHYEIVQAIKIGGPLLSQAERDEIIRTVAMLPAPISEAAKPTPYDGRKRFAFGVSYRDRYREIVAHDPREAWALFCDEAKSWPGPKLGKVECLGEAA